METLTTLPDLEGRRFGSLNLGYDRIQKIREEHSTLLSLAALLLGVDPTEVTAKQVAALVLHLSTQLAALPSDLTSQSERLAAVRWPD